MNNNEAIEIVLVIDKSGSMADIADDAIGSFNSFLEEQKKLPGDAKMWVTLFDTSYTFYSEGKAIQDVMPLDRTTYRPGGNTALLDAIGKTIDEVNKRNPSKVLFAILTDGQENSSREYSYAGIQSLIKEKEALGWQILFLASGLDAAKEAMNIGISSAKTISMENKNSRNYSASNMAMNAYTVAFRATDASEFMAMEKTRGISIMDTYTSALNGDDVTKMAADIQAKVDDPNPPPTANP